MEINGKIEYSLDMVIYLRLLGRFVLVIKQAYVSIKSEPSCSYRNMTVLFLFHIFKENWFVVTNHDYLDGIHVEDCCCLFIYLNRRSQQATGGLQVQTAESRTRCVNIAGQCKCILETNIN